MLLLSLFAALIFSQNILASEPSRQLTDASVQTEEDNEPRPHCGVCSEALNVSTPIVWTHCTHGCCLSCFTELKHARIPGCVARKVEQQIADLFICPEIGCGKPFAQSPYRTISPTDPQKFVLDMTASDRAKCTLVDVSVYPTRGERFFTLYFANNPKPDAVCSLSIPPCYEAVVNCLALINVPKKGDGKDTKSGSHILTFRQSFQPPFPAGEVIFPFAYLATLRFEQSSNATTRPDSAAS